MLKRTLLTTDAVGGVWRYSMELARGFASREIEIVLAVLGPPPRPAQHREAAAIPGVRLVVTGLVLDWLAETPDQTDFAAEVLAAVARQVDADTVQLHAPALMGRAVWPVPVMIMAHSCVGTWWQAVRGGPLPAGLAWRAAAAERGIARADTVAAPSTSFARALRACYGVTRPIEVVWNGRTPIGTNVPRRAQAFTVGRLWDEGKNIAVLDEAAGKLEWPVMAAGPAIGPNGTQVNCRHLRMLGPLDAADVGDEYAAASVFVSVARYEPFGLAVLEAAQAGCALVLSDIPTFRELWDGAAVFVPSDAPDDIAGAMGDLLGRPDVCASQGARAFRRAASFTVQQMTDATWVFHDQMATRARTAA